MKIKVIKNKEDYKEALQAIELLILKDPDPDSVDGDKLNILTQLVEDYESKTFSESLPDPIDAIKYRMEQENLKPKDLIPYIGSRSKVSEVFSRKRPLTLSMIRSLESGLGIPAKVLLKEIDELKDAKDITWNRFPVKEMKRKGYFIDLKISDIGEALRIFFAPLGSTKHVLGMLRKTNYKSIRPVDKYALLAWSAAVVNKAKKVKNIGKFKHGTIDSKFMQNLVQLSVQKEGPILAQDLLKKIGIILVIKPPLSKTYLDGAVIMTDKDYPIIGLTLRYNRLDNFWFNLMHELSHIALHYNSGLNLFYDNLDDKDSTNLREKEADELAGETLIPENKWQVSPARLIQSSMAAESLASELGIHIAIVAGRMRKEGGKYQYLNKIINQVDVRDYFPDEKWI